MRLEIVDVGPRDGLQNEDKTLTPEVRAELCDKLANAGVPRVEAASFVNPKRVPQMAGAEEVMASIERSPHTSYAGLVLNERGYERAIEAGVDEVRYAFPVTETFAKRNQNTTVADATRLAARLVERARLDGVRVSITLSAAFGDPFEGRGRTRTRTRDRRPGRDSGPRRDRTGRHHRRGSPEPGPNARRERRSPTASPSAATSTTRATRHSQRRGRRRERRDRPRRLRRRHGRLPLRPARHGQHRHRRPRLPPPQHGLRHGNRPRRPHRSGVMALAATRQRASRTGAQGWKFRLSGQIQHFSISAISENVIDARHTTAAGLQFAGVDERKVRAKTKS